MIGSRRRRDDILRLGADLGGPSVVAALYDVRRNVTATSVVSAWADARGATGYGPTLSNTGTARPAYSASALTITFDGINDYLRGTNGLTAITGPCWIALIGTLVYDASSFMAFGEMGTGSTRCIQAGASSTNTIITSGPGGGSAAVDVTGLTGRRVSHHRLVTAGGGNSTHGTQIGSGVEVTTIVAETITGSADRLTLGATGADSPGNFSAIMLRAAIVGAGAYTTAQKAIVNNWATTYHGATL